MSHPPNLSLIENTRKKRPLDEILGELRGVKARLNWLLLVFGMLQLSMGAIMIYVMIRDL